MSTATQRYDAIKYKTPTGSKTELQRLIQEAALRMLLNNPIPKWPNAPTT